MTTAHVFIATSVDGFIARLDGGIDWLTPFADPVDDAGYADFMADKELIVMGRGTFESVRSFDPWPYTKRVMVISHHLTEADVPAHLQGKVELTHATPRELLHALDRQGVGRVYVDGGKLIQSFLREGLIQDLVITTVPVLLGSGRRLFGELNRDIALACVASRRLRSGLVQSTYRVLS